MKPGKHKFIVKHARDADWKTGLRTDFEYNDLGIRDATNGDFSAHVIRIADASADHHTGKHAHVTEFQMIYVLQGEARFWFEDEGEVSVSKGDCFYQPDGLVHDALWMSDDLELLEITSPGDFKTVRD
jgi:mannose-6-phosphate isomerase-like protein (cupin superfamily)